MLSGEIDEQAESTEDLGPLKLFCVTVIADTCHLTIQTHTVYTEDPNINHAVKVAKIVPTVDGGSDNGRS